MSRRLLAATALLATLLLSGCSNRLLKNTQVLDVDSSLHIDPTGSFTVAAAWDLRYTYDCSSQLSRQVGNAGHISLSVLDSDDQSYNFEHPSVSASGRSGGATLHFTMGGTFYVQVTSVCSWRVVVTDLNGG